MNRRATEIDTKRFSRIVPVKHPYFIHRLYHQIIHEHWPLDLYSLSAILGLAFDTKFFIKANQHPTEIAISDNDDCVSMCDCRNDILLNAQKGESMGIRVQLGESGKHFLTCSRPGIGNCYRLNSSMSRCSSSSTSSSVSSLKPDARGEKSPPQHTGLLKDSSHPRATENMIHKRYRDVSKSYATRKSPKY